MNEHRIRIKYQRDGIYLFIYDEKVARYERESACWIPLKPGVQVTDGPAGIEIEMQG